ncbi:hypothetical protein M0R04_15365 [Candidatus Dojkabacteria bacterium]|jgi:hypothetical protein|nr:hypothetical protein [Candidatus Dojkabacteria bacterium]
MSKDSPTTRIAVLEANHKNLMDKLDDILDRFDKFEEKLDTALEKKAGKWVEGVIKWIGIIIGSGILGYIGGQLIKLIEL